MTGFVVQGHIYMTCGSERADETHAVIAFGGVCCCSGTQSCRNTILRTFQMLWNETDSLLVKLSRLIAQSHMTFLMHLEELILKMHFHLPLFTLTLESKTTSSKRKKNVQNVAFPSLASRAILKNAH